MIEDEIDIEILDDGRIKAITDHIPAAIHTNAENFFRDIAKICGGKPTKRPRVDKKHKGKATHSHSH